MGRVTWAQVNPRRGLGECGGGGFREVRGDLRVTCLTGVSGRVWGRGCRGVSGGSGQVSWVTCDTGVSSVRDVGRGVQGDLRVLWGSQGVTCDTGVSITVQVLSVGAGAAEPGGVRAASGRGEAQEGAETTGTLTVVGAWGWGTGEGGLGWSLEVPVVFWGRFGYFGVFW